LTLINQKMHTPYHLPK